MSNDTSRGDAHVEATNSTSGHTTAWVRLDDAQLVEGDNRARRFEKVGKHVGHRFPPSGNPTRHRGYHGRCEVAAEKYLGRDLPDGVVVRGTPNSTGRPWPRFEDVMHAVVVIARGPFTSAQRGTSSSAGALRYVELRGWIRGARIADVGAKQGGGYIIDPDDLEPMDALPGFLEQTGDR